MEEAENSPVPPPRPFPFSDETMEDPPVSANLASGGRPSFRDIMLKGSTPPQFISPSEDLIASKQATTGRLNGIPSVTFSDDVMNKILAPLQDALLIRVLGNRVSLKTL